MKRLVNELQELIGLDGESQAVEERYNKSLRELHIWTDRFFSRLLLVQWLACIAIAALISPLAWEGRVQFVHPHVLMAVFLGAVITAYPAWLGFHSKGEPFIRHLLAVAQMLVSALLIELTGGRLESHFHIFGSLAFIAFYRDIRVLISASVVVFTDHLVRGFFWPDSVYGVSSAPMWRSAEHGAWVLFEVAFLSLSIERSLQEMRQVAMRRVALEKVNARMEEMVDERTLALRESEDRFRVLFADSPVGLYQTTKGGRLRMANTMMLEIFACETLDELLAEGLEFNERGIMQSARVEVLRESAAKKDICSRDITWQRKDGARIYLRERVRVFRDERGTVRHLEGSVEDISEQRQLEDRYLQSQKVQAIGQLAGGVAHDFNNILTAIIGYSDLLLEKSHLELAPKRHVQEIKRASERAALLTQQLLAFSRKQTLEPRVLQLNEVIADMNKMLTRLVGENIQIKTRFDYALPFVKADPGQLQQVLMNLVVNARDAMPSGGQLTIETSAVEVDERGTAGKLEMNPGHYVLLAVSDNGIGMSAETKARVFEPFFTTKGVGHGTGLGLSTCHGIIKQSGGHIDLYSELGYGTTFRVYIPVTHETIEDQVAEEDAGEIVEGNETIMLVEDEPMVRELGCLALSSLGYRVIEASNGLEALQRLDVLGNQKIQLVVTDVVMPEMGGRDLAEKVRERFPNTRILFSSGYTQDAIARTDLILPGVSFLPKPYTMAQLAAKVRDILDSKPVKSPRSQVEELTASEYV